MEYFVIMKYIIFLFFFSFIGSCLCDNRCSNKKEISTKIEKKVLKKIPATPQEAKKTYYYCFIKKRVYDKKKKEFAQAENSTEKLKKYFKEKKNYEYDFKWYKKANKYYLDTSSWKLNINGKQVEKKNAKWIHSACRVYRNKTVLDCPILSYKGLLWRIKFQELEDNYISLILRRIPISKEEKQKAEMAKFFGVKHKRRVSVCLRYGLSPFQEFSQKNL